MDDDERGTSPYALDDDHRQTIQEKIMAELEPERVMKPLRDAVDAVIRLALETTTEYLADEYSSEIESLVRSRANRLVVSLLKGDAEAGRYFDMTTRVSPCGLDKGQEVSSDNNGIRAAIVEAFAERIQTAEMISMRREHDAMKKDLENYRKR